MSPNELDYRGRRINTRRLAQALLLGIEERGTHATGAAWRDAAGDPVIQKRDVAATQFVRGLSIPRRAQVAVLHTRFWTQGSPTNNDNNHPISTGGIVGVHNGAVWNDDELFYDMGINDRRKGAVDSEAIFATLAYGVEEYSEKNRLTRVPDAKTTTDLLEVIEGPAAIAWLDNQDPADVLHVSRIWQNPLVWGQTAAGSFVFASTEEALLRACLAARVELVHMEEMKDGQYARIKSGRVTDFADFIPGESTFATSYSPWRRHRSSYVPSWEQDLGVPTGPVAIYPTNRSAEEMAEYEQWWHENHSVIDAAKSGIDGEQYEWISTGDGGLVPLPRTTQTPLELEWDEQDMVEAVANATGESVPAVIQKEEVTVEADFVPTRYLNLAQSRPQMDEEQFAISYADRLAAAREWFDSIKPTPTNLAMRKMERDLHYWLRPGDWVNLTFMGVDTYGQVINMPTQFPGGAYVLRVIVENGKRETGWEVIYVTRTANEFSGASSQIGLRSVVCQPINDEEEVNASV